MGADNPTRKIHAGVYEPLIDHKLGTADATNLEGVLAKSWKVSPDGLTYTFALRENVKFHDGSTLSAEDVKLSLERMKKIGLGRSWALDPVKEVRVVNPMTVELVLARPYPPFLLGLPVVFIVSSQAVKKNQKGDDLAQAWLTQNEAGTGPFRLREFKVGEQIVMDRFDGYWRGWPAKHLDRVVLKLVAEPATQKILMEGGQGHWADTISPGDLESFAQRKDFVVTAEPTWGIQFFWMNTKKAPLDDPRVRKAMRLAFPYEQMIKDVMRGRGTLPQGYLSPGYLTQEGPPEKTDLQAARKLLAEVGVAPGTHDHHRVLLRARLPASGRGADGRQPAAPRHRRQDPGRDIRDHVPARLRRGPAAAHVLLVGRPRHRRSGLVPVPDLPLEVALLGQLRLRRSQDRRRSWRRPATS